MESSSTASTDQFISVHLKTAPAFNSGTGTVTVTMADETAEIYVNAADSSLMVNGVQAVDTGVTPNVVAYAAGKGANIKALAVSDGTATTGDVVILNYVNGTFALGSGSTPGTTVALKHGKANSLIVKGTPKADSFAIGPSLTANSASISLTNGAKSPSLDVLTTDVSSFDFFMGDGDDTFTSNATVTGGVFVNPITAANGVHIFGGNGNDTLVETAVPTPYETFSGGPGTDTVDYSARPAAAALVGTVALTNASKAVVGSGTAFKSALAVGQDVTFGAQAGARYRIATITDDTHATLTANYTGVTLNSTASSTMALNSVSVVVDATGAKNSGSGLWAASCNPAGGTFEQDVILDADVIKGTPGDDQLMGDVSGSITLNGGPGNDTFCEGGDAYNGGTDKLVGGGGVDTVDYSQRTAALKVTMDGATKSGDPAGNGSKGENDIIGADIQNVMIGSGTGSVYTGNPLNNTFYAGTGGTAVVNGMDGDDTLNEGPDGNHGGSETFHGGKGTDTVDYSGRSANLTVVMDGKTAGGDTGNSEADVIDVDVENLYGGSGTDALSGNALDNDIEGNGGGDTLCGMAGNDTLVGNPAAGAGSTASLHGGDCVDTAEPGAFNMCVNAGSGNAQTASTANCELLTK